jgi:hypothetical protein
MRCTLRISPRGTLVDGEPMSRAEAVAYCKRTAGGAIVVMEDNDAHQWTETRSALEREGVRIYVRGPLCYDPKPLGCRPRLKPEPRVESRRVLPVSE